MKKDVRATFIRRRDVMGYARLLGSCFLRFGAWLVAGAMLLALPGCAIFTGIPRPPMTSTATAPASGYQLGDDAIRAYNAETNDPIKKKILRNEIIDARMAEIDHKFADFERDLYLDGIGEGVGTDWTVLALTTASTLVTPAHTKSLLSGLGTMFVGADAALDKRALFDKTLPALLAQMVAARETARASIRQSETLPVDEYSWFAAESDLEHFRFAGSIPGAITSVSEDAGHKAATARAAQREVIRTSYVRTVSSNKLRAYWKPDGTPNAGHEQEIEKWLRENHEEQYLSPGGITQFLHAPDMEDARTQMMKQLGIQ